MNANGYALATSHNKCIDCMGHDIEYRRRRWFGKDCTLKQVNRKYEYNGYRELSFFSHISKNVCVICIWIKYGNRLKRKRTHTHTHILLTSSGPRRDDISSKRRKILYEILLLCRKQGDLIEIRELARTVCQRFEATILWIYIVDMQISVDDRILFANIVCETLLLLWWLLLLLLLRLLLEFSFRRIH